MRRGAGAVRTAEEPAADLGSMPDHLASAVFAQRSHRVDRALEAVEGVSGAGGDHFERLVVIVSADLTLAHFRQLPSNPSGDRGATTTAGSIARRAGCTRCEVGKRRPDSACRGRDSTRLPRMGHDGRVHLLERDGALAALAEYARDAEAGSARVVLVAGEAGVGKTSLLDALRDRLTARPTTRLPTARADVRWLWGACEGSFTPRPLGPVFDIAAQLGGDLARACSVGTPREQVFRALLDALLSSDALTVVAVEDVHWADDATLDLLRFLTSRLRDSRTLLLVTYRNDGLPADHPLRVIAGELSTQRTTRRIDLPPLSEAAVTALADGSGIAPEALFALTGGNPFLVTEVLDAGAGVVPPSAREAVLARVARLSPAARGVLEAAAVIGTRVELRLLRSVIDGDVAAIDECLTSGALVSAERGFRFRHEIARIAVGESMPAHRRIEAHRRVLEALTAAGETNNARLAHHAEAAADATAVVTFAVTAGRHAAKLAAHHEAAVQFRRALRFVDSSDAELKASLYAELAAEDVLVDDWHGAAEAQQAALELWRELGDPMRVGDILRELARTMWRLCRGADAVAAADAAISVLEGLPPAAELAWAYATRSSLEFNKDWQVAARWNAKAAAIARELGDPALLSFTLNSLGVIKDGLGEGGVPELREALEIALTAGDEQQAGRAYTNLQAVLENNLRLREAEQVFAEGMAYCAERDLSTYGNCLRGGHAWLLDRLGRWDDAVALCTFELTERNLSPINKISKLITLGTIQARRGSPEAGAALDEALALAEGADDPGYRAEVALARLESAWLAGDGEDVRREAARLVDNAAVRDPTFRGAAATWLRRCDGSLPAGLRVTPPYSVMLAGDWRAAADDWLQRGCPYDAGLTLLDSGSPDAIVEAIRLFDRIGAAATVARAQEMLRALGVRTIPRGPRTSTRANRFRLTRREQEVFALVCEGLTNADIANRLVVAEKTIDNHVSAVLAKLGVNSRREAARMASAI